MSKILLRECGIYKITNIINSKVYIGSSIDIKSRWKKHKQHLRNNKHHNDHLQHAWRLYGEQNFKFEILENTDLNILSLEEKENYWIQYYNSSDKIYGYNLYHYSRKPLGYKYSDEVIQKRKERNAIYGHCWTGKKHSEETKLKMCLAQKGKIFSEEHRNKISNFRKNFKSSEETKLKISKASSGEKNPRALLNEKKVKEIRELFKNNMKVSKIAKLYNMSWNAIDSIVKEKSWRNK